MNSDFHPIRFCKHNIRLLTGFLAICFFVFAQSILAQDTEGVAFEFEGGALWQTRNDVRIPNATGTEFSIVDSVGKGPYGVFRVEAAFDINEKHGFRVVIAPLEINDTGEFDQSIFFAGEQFDPGVSADANSTE
jgi:hypothetical protein